MMAPPDPNARILNDDRVLEDRATGYGVRAAEHRITTAKRKKKKRVSPLPKPLPKDFLDDVAIWVKTHQIILLTNAKFAAQALTDATQLILARMDKDEKAIIGETILSLIPLPKILGTVRPLLKGAITYFQDQAEQSDHFAKQQFIDEFQEFFEAIEKLGRGQIFGQAREWLQQAEESSDPIEKIKEITPLLDIEEVRDEKTDPRIISREKYLSEIMKVYWDIQSPVANFEVRALQGFVKENLMPVAPNKIQNWPDVIKAIKAADPSWTTIQGRPIEVSQGGERLLFSGPNDTNRQTIENFILTSRKMLEDTL